ncbi:bifunctional [glutamate--ammonia ligase]-adenylyl-L-tyrosine phosphorylase/[glutamate--ammonia-ligase] adenylyltransferase [Denitromonas iodatirespirans]|uniref:Bifunctional glutamine synthetase adenylyltransferase/adenylyl-removing enzyme n=1 Tax=Denitromonas iodatirespirans TaxID=2795389 RepID=A0A944DDK2_DENI1|nr:bifunctional [glutamate--ammonia ligase]-adenylyl-L-tyrosine phosphorylase/[glutamate--ammonia-ligase] adenylyltransferase [Denitromonas iodatirespirans]MBT0962518.1 bifunctional [glutamate--ammonia ligase]-adenylyl-L-tyrosine phosphorylase/[glutamate--ammonia-ligase] adenylyltransferase [Denitromonas iodatirespirans]
MSLNELADLPEKLRLALPFSRYLKQMLQSRSWLADQLAAHLDAPLDTETMSAFIDPGALDRDSMRAALRRLRTWVLCHLAVRDLAGDADLAEVTETMSAFADLAVRVAHDVEREALIARHGKPAAPGGWEQELLVVGMGKLGGRELNVSSDIDLIFVYPEDGDTGGDKVISNFEFFERLGKRIIQALAEVTEHGQVFRVDMRLRPNGDSGPLVCSFDMLENYFIAQGREWERYAWIKARVMLGKRFEQLDAITRPFVFRKYLDFGAINAMRDLHAQIRREVARKDRAHNIKLGPGGIREIEFIAQVFQLIRGGRERSLQIKPTQKVLDLLAEQGVLAPEVVDALKRAYVFLRRLEHRLQYLDDAQTHDLPEQVDEQALIAGAMGFADYPALRAELDRHRAEVSRHFEMVFGDPDEEGHELDAVWLEAEDIATLVPLLEKLKYAEPETSARRLQSLHRGTRYQQLPPKIKSRFDALVPRVVETAAEAANPDDTLSRCLDLLDAIGGRGAYLAMLQQYPQALHKVGELVSASRWAAQYLARHPILLDELLDARQLNSKPDWPAFAADLRRQCDDIEPDMERQMDLMREQHHTQAFRLLTQDLAGVLTVEALSDHLSALADALLDITVPLCWRKLRRRHRDDAPAFAIVSYGKLGGKELGYASDLDIVFLYDDPHPEAAEHYSRLAQRINTWLSSQTAAGQLFETDLRLRPNGDAGLLVCSIDAFRKYQLESAWRWEHQALTRARFSAGDTRVGDAFEAIRIEVLRQPRELAPLREDVLAMRKKMMDAHSNKSGLFNLKHDRGGLVDVEFIVQYLVLAHAHQHPQLTGNLGNIALLRIAGELGLIPPDLARRSGDTYREFRRLQHRQRLNGLRVEVPHESVGAHRDAVRALWSLVLETPAGGTAPQ